MAIQVNEYIVRFDVSMNVAELVQGVYGQDCLGYVELGHVFWQPVDFGEECEQVAAAVVVHDEIQVVVVLERVV